MDLVINTVNPADVSFKTRGPRTHKWAPLVEAIGNLTVDGPGLSINVQGDPIKFRNTIGQVVSSKGYTAHSESSETIKFRTRLTTDENTVIITCHTRLRDEAKDSENSEDGELDDLD